MSIGTDMPGPLRNLLSRLNTSPSAELLERVAVADRGFEEHERVAMIEPSLKKILRDGQIPSPWNTFAYGNIDRFFKIFGIKARSLTNRGDVADDVKNTESYDPDQEYEVYEYSSDITLELKDPFQLLARAGAKSVGESDLEASARAREWIHVRTYRRDDRCAEFRVISTSPFPDQTLSPYLFIYSLAATTSVSDPSRLSFDTMMSNFGFLTMEDDCKGYSVFQLRDAGNETSDPKDATSERWLLVQEFEGEKGEWISGDWPELKRKESKHWWYKHGWQTNSVVLYRREGMTPSPPGSAEESEEE